MNETTGKSVMKYLYVYPEGTIWCAKMFLINEEDLWDLTLKRLQNLVEERYKILKRKEKRFINQAYKFLMGLEETGSEILQKGDGGYVFIQYIDRKSQEASEEQIKQVAAACAKKVIYEQVIQEIK